MELIVNGTKIELNDVDRVDIDIYGVKSQLKLTDNSGKLRVKKVTVDKLSKLTPSNKVTKSNSSNSHRSRISSDDYSSSRHKYSSDDDPAWSCHGMYNYDGSFNFDMNPYTSF